MTALSVTPIESPPGDELVRELEMALRRTRGDGCRIVSITRRPYEYRTSFALDQVDLTLESGETLALIVKDTSRSTLSAQARRAKPLFLANQRREIDTYRGILTPANLGTPICYGASVDPRAERAWLFLERVDGVELFQVGDIALWDQVARWLARFHVHFSGHEEQAKARSAAPLLVYDRDFYRIWPRRALAFASAWAPRDREQLAWLVERYEPVVERLASLPTTVIHGEFYASNVLVQEAVDGTRVCPVDWETTAIGPGLIDLAALTAGSWSDEARAGFLRAYHDALASAGTQIPIAGLQSDFLYCRLHLAVQWLGWAADWTPPREHTHDWLSEAIRLAEELRL